MAQEREAMLEEMRDLEKHLKLDDTIIQHFVPVRAAVAVRGLSFGCGYPYVTRVVVAKTSG